METIASCAFGMEVNSVKDPNSPFLLKCRGFFEGAETTSTLRSLTLTLFRKFLPGNVLFFLSQQTGMGSKLFCAVNNVPWRIFSQTHWTTRNFICSEFARNQSFAVHGWHFGPHLSYFSHQKMVPWNRKTHDQCQKGGWGEAPWSFFGGAVLQRKTVEGNSARPQLTGRRSIFWQFSCFWSIKTWYLELWLAALLAKTTVSIFRHCHVYVGPCHFILR